MAERDYREELYAACRKHFPGIGWSQYGTRCEGVWTKVQVVGRVLSNEPVFEVYLLHGDKPMRRVTRRMTNPDADACMAEMAQETQRMVENLQGVLRD